MEHSTLETTPRPETTPHGYCQGLAERGATQSHHCGRLLLPLLLPLWSWLLARESLTPRLGSTAAPLRPLNLTHRGRCSHWALRC